MMAISSSALSLTAPEFAAAWAETTEKGDHARRIENFLGLTRFLQSSEFVEVGRRLLAARAERTNPEHVLTQAARGIGLIRESSVILSLHRDGTQHINSFAFVSDAGTAVLTTEAAGFAMEIGDLRIIRSQVQSLLAGLDVTDRVFMQSDSGSHVAGIGWSRGMTRVLHDDVWVDSGPLDIESVADWFLGSGFLMVTQ